MLTQYSCIILNTNFGLETVSKLGQIKRMMVITQQLDCIEVQTRQAVQKDRHKEHSSNPL